MALKIFLSPSMATKWQPTLRQPRTKAPVENHGRCKQKSHKKQSQGHNREDSKKLRTRGCNAIKNYVADLRGGLNEQLRPSGMSTIIKSTPIIVPCILLKARVLSDLCCTIQTTFSMILIAKLEHDHHEAMEKKRRH
jgi:hypothetical protein